MQIRVFVLKRPFGVSIMMAGGLKGYSGCMAQVREFECHNDNSMTLTKPRVDIAIVLVTEVPRFNCEAVFELKQQAHRESQLPYVHATSVWRIRRSFNEIMPLCMTK